MKKASLLYILVLVCLLGNFTNANAQNVTVNAAMDSTVIWIGEQTALTFEITQPNNIFVQFPLFSDTIPGGLDIVEPLKIDSLNANSISTITHKYIVTAFEDSLLYIPPFPFVVNETDTLWSNSLSLKVVQPFEVDMESNSITDIKPIYKPPFNWAGFFKIVFLALLVLAVIIAVVILIRKYIRKKPELEIAKAEPERPAHIVALEKLNNIRDEKLWQQGRLKEYYTELTDVLRVYIGRVFEINAMEMTSEEILDSLIFLKREQKDIYHKLTSILRTADLVKFAKWKPLNDENEMCLRDAFVFVENTKIEEEIDINEAIINEDASQNNIETE